MDFAKTIDRLAREKQFNDAYELAVQWTEEFPQEAKAWGKLGNVYSQQGRHTEAVSAYEHAAHLNPADPVACFKLGQTRHRLQDFAGAAEAFGKCEAAAEAVGESADQYAGASILGAAYCFAKLGDAAGAREALERAHDDDSSSLSGSAQNKAEVAKAVEMALAAPRVAPVVKKAVF